MCCGIVGRMFNLSRNLTFSQHSYSHFFISVSITAVKFKFKPCHFSGTLCASQVGSIPFPSRPPAVRSSCIATPEKLPCNCHRRAPHKDTLYEGGLGAPPSPPPRDHGRPGLTFEFVCASATKAASTHLLCRLIMFQYR